MMKDVKKVQIIRIKKRLSQFKTLPKSKYFEEFLFCLLTPQSNAQRCLVAVEQLLTLKEFKEENVKKILRTKTRFHNIKTKRILRAEKTFKKIAGKLEMQNRKDLRNLIAKEVNGYGLKEASHFLRNIGKSDNQIAILDRHILRNLKSTGILKEDKIKNNKDYLELELKYLEFAHTQKLKPDELDLIWWSQENGEVFK